MQKCDVANKSPVQGSLSPCCHKHGRGQGKVIPSIVFWGREPFLWPSAQVDKGRCGRNGFREPSSPHCTLVLHSCVFLMILLTLIAFVCGGVPGRTGAQLAPCSPDENPSQVRIRARTKEGCDIYSSLLCFWWETEFLPA